MKEQAVSKRAWVKNAAIIFLAVMLVLTFFSNTIMNRSLPEVAAQYTTSGSITARIRGSGTVTANETFEVKVNQTRTVSERPVRLGDEVSVGDVLIRLTGDVSDELEAARNSLRELELKLRIELVNMSVGDNRVAAAARAVQSATNALSDAQRALSGVSYSESAYNAALAAYNYAQAVKNQAQNDFNAASVTTRAKQYDLSIAQAELTDLDNRIDAGEIIDPEVYAAALQKQNDAQLAFSIASAASVAAGDALSAAMSAAAGPEAEYSIQNSKREAWFSASSNVRNAQLALDEANANLSLARAEDSASSTLDTINLDELKRQIEEQREKIDELETDGGSTEIKSLVNGKVTQINISPGDKTEIDTPLILIEVTDRGYSLSFSVSAEQASRVNVGDNAEVDRGWWSWGEELTAILVGIRNDPQNPVTNRILHFNVSGDVESGSQLNLTLAQRSENYNIIIPNSALRSDTNGDFVLVVISRSSPLGNRYIATRADVTVLASDDTNTAVVGGLTGWDFVITRASAPIDPGMQVRLVDNP